MVNRTLDIVYFDDNPTDLNILKTASDVAVRQKEFHFDIRLTPYHIKSDLTLEKIDLLANGDIFFIDFLLKGCKHDGLHLSREIRKRNPHAKIIQLTSYSVQDQKDLTIGALEKGIINATINKENMVKEYVERVKKHASKRLVVTLTGVRGKLAGGFIDILRDQPYIEQLRMYSGSLAGRHDGYDLIKTSKQLHDEKRFEFAPNLESALENSDCVILCSSKGLRPAERDDRTDLFLDDAPKMATDAQVISQVKYPGLVLPFANSIGEFAYLINQIGKGRISSTQVTSPINVDGNRIFGSFSSFLEHSMRNEKYLKNIEDFIKENAYGLHGVPELLTYNGRLPWETQKLVLAVEKTKKLGIDIMNASREIQQNRLDAQRTSALFLEELASYKENPSYASYCEYSVDGTKGFIALPISISYGENIRVRFNNSPRNQYKLSNPEIQSSIKTIFNRQRGLVEKFFRSNMAESK